MTTITEQLIIEKEKFRMAIPSIEADNKVKVLLAFVRGSHMYGTATEKSDVDITFVYQQSTKTILRGDYKEQITVGGNDVVGYEIERFLRLLGQNNPNILEALDIPEDCMIYKAPVMDNILIKEMWLSKLCKNTILGYANSQIKKATGLNKKMNKPMVEKKDIVDFCYIIDGAQSHLLKTIFKEDVSSNKFGLVKNPNGKGIYGLYYNMNGDPDFRGLIKDGESTQLRLSSVSKSYNKPSTMWYNQDGFEVWNKEYQSYQKWLVERNEERHNTNDAHGKNYDSKNMMHLFRLLNMAFNLVFEWEFKVRESDVEWLMEIRNGEIEYDDLIEYSEFLFETINDHFEYSPLQNEPDFEKIKDLIYEFRTNE